MDRFRTGTASVGYFSMEIGLDAPIPTYAGGLGVLAGDALRAAADLGIPMVGVSLLHRDGYFRQHVDSEGSQHAAAASWDPGEFMRLMTPQAVVTIEGREVAIRAWRYLIRGVTGNTVPVYFLDSALAQNDPADRELTSRLYGGDAHVRLRQEALLGLGGVAMLRALGHTEIQVFHMNEGHSALVAVALLEEQVWGRGLNSTCDEDLRGVRRRCVFTTHTPVAAGHDRFPLDLARSVLGSERVSAIEEIGGVDGDVLDMTALGLTLARYVNGVSRKHGAITRQMFPDRPIDAVTNGVHAATWVSPPFQRLFDAHVSGWREDNFRLRYATSIPLEEIEAAHRQAKMELLALVEDRTGRHLDPHALTIGFARRATAYKRADLLLWDTGRLAMMAAEIGPLQVIYGGKAHPDDDEGKAMIRRVVEGAAALGKAVPVVFLEEYDMALAKHVCAGVDLWLNTPRKPMEASGTSGMKAAMNGVPGLSVLDGWWLEGHLEGVTGWSIGDGLQDGDDPAAEAASLYDRLSEAILPMFYSRPREYAAVMRSAIALNGSFFNAERMMAQLLTRAYHVTARAQE